MWTLSVRGASRFSEQGFVAELLLVSQIHFFRRCGWLSVHNGDIHAASVSLQAA